MLQIDIEDHMLHCTQQRESEIGERTTGLITPNMTQGLKEVRDMAELSAPKVQQTGFIP